MGDDAKFVKEDAEKVLDIILLINQIGLKKYEKDWRKIHKQLGISASHKVKITNVSYHQREVTQPKDKRKKLRHKINYAYATYKDYKYYVCYNINRTDETRTYRITSYFSNDIKEGIERKIN